MTVNNPSGDDLSPFAALAIVTDVLLSIALPTAVLALLGRWIDVRLNASPWFTVGGLLIAVVIVGALVSRKAEKLRKRLYPK